MVARPTATMDRVGSRTGSLSALVPGTTAGDIHITDAAFMVATLMIDLRDADMKDVVLLDMVLMDVARRFGAASKGAAEAKASAEDSMEGPAAAVNNKLIGVI